LRKHKLDVVFYDHQMKEYIVKDIVVGEEELTTISIEIKEPIKAIIINHGIHTYCKVRYDE